MKIVYIITGLSTGGAEIMLHKLLQRLDRRLFEPQVISLTSKGDVGPLIEALGIPVFALGMRRELPNPFLLLRLVLHLRRLKPDIVSTWMYHADLLGGFAARLAGCSRVIWGLRNSDLSPDKSTRSTLLVARICAWLSPWLPTRILSCSSRSRHVHVALGYQADKTHVIPNGFDLARFRPDLTAHKGLRVELGLPVDVHLVGLIARFDPQKNHAGFMEVAEKVLLRRNDVHFVLAGTGIDASNLPLQKMIADRGLQTRMHLLGRRDDVPRVMAALDTLVCASTYGEAFPNVLGEAMACEVPCIVTDVGDSAHIVGNTGHVVAPHDMAGMAHRITDILNLPDKERRELGIQARLRIQENFEIDVIAGYYQTHYDEVLRGH